MDLVSRLRDRAERLPERMAFGFLDRDGAVSESLSCAGLELRARAVAAVLQERGAVGDRAVLCLPTGPTFVAALLGCFLAGVVAVPAPSLRGRRSVPRVLSLLADSDAKQLLLPAPLTEGQRSWLGAMAENLTVIAMDAIDTSVATLWRPTCPDADAIAMLQYTSGSTSQPRGVMLTHRQLFENERSIAEHFGIDADQTIASWLPLHHDLGLIGTLLQPLYSGAGCYFIQPLSFLDAPLSWLNVISDLRATISGGPNFAFELASRAAGAEVVDRLDLSCWRVAFCGAEPVRPATLARFAERFAAFGFDSRAFCPTYGLAEATLFVCGGRPGNTVRSLRVDPSALALNRVVLAAPSTIGHDLASNGRPPAEHRIAIVDPGTGRPAPPDQVGEIWVSGPAVASGYWRRPVESEQQFSVRLPGAGNRRFLRTGDLGFMRDGELYICGRCSDLLIVRGRNIHPEDVERSAEDCDLAVRPGGAAAFPIEADGEERAVLLVEVARDLPSESYGSLAARLRAAVVEALDIDPATIALLPPGALPRTTSGKVRRKDTGLLWREGKLRMLFRLDHKEADGHRAIAVESRSTAGPLNVLAAALEVGIDRLAGNPKLAELGLDSLKATRLALELQRRLGVKVTAGWLLDRRRIGDVVGLVPQPGSPESEASDGEPPNVGTEVVLNEAQQALWYLDSLGGRGAADVITGAVDVTSPIDRDLLRPAFFALLDRHPGLRMTYVFRDGAPRGVVTLADNQAFLWTDLGAVGDGELADRLTRLAQAPIDLRKGPVAQLHLLLRTGAAPTLLFRLHHIAGDLHAVGLFLDELGKIYAGTEMTALPPAVSAGDVTGEAVFRYGPDDLDFWRARISEIPDGMALPSDRLEAAAAGTEGAELHVALSRGVTRRLSALAADAGATLNATLIAALHVLAGGICAAQRTVIGMPTANRGHPGTERAIACLANILPITADLRDDPSFRVLLDRVRADVVASLDHQTVPFPRIAAAASASREAAQHPLLRLVFAWYGKSIWQAAGLPALALNRAGITWQVQELALTTREVPNRAAQYDLAILAAEIGGRLEFTLRYRTALFAPDTIRRIARRLRRLLALIAQRPDLRLSDLTLVLPEEVRRIEAWNATAVAAPAQRIDLSILGQACKTPDGVAVRFGEAAMSYHSLAETAERVAGQLLRRGLGPGDIVAVVAERCLEMPALLVGILRTGCAFLPLDPEEPPARRNGKLQRSGAALLVTAATAEVRDCEPVETVRLESLLAGSCAPPCSIGSVEQNPLCYVLHTSGSTGHPKGVMVSHSGLANRLAWMQRFTPIGPGDVVLQKTPVTFDVALWELFWPLITGATSVLAAPGGHRDPFYLLDLMERAGVTIVHFVPSMLRPILDAQHGGPPPRSLRHVFCSGETLPADIAARARSQLGCALSNLYGPTEASIDVTAWRCGPEDEAEVPIGRPIDNTVIEILDPSGRRAPFGTVGQLAIGGAGLAWGYIGRPGMTAERFVPDPWRQGARLYLTGDLARYRADGAILFRGRTDDQVKIRGRRVEPGEIEAVMRTHPTVADAAVVALQDAAGHNRLLAYVVPRDGAAPRDLASYLETRLPGEMRPDAFKVIDNLPLTPSGKLDRRVLMALKPDLQASDSHGELATPTEARLAEIWRSMFGGKPVASESDFFRLGGHSLSLAGLQVKIVESFGVRIPLAQLISLPSLAAMARLIDEMGPVDRAEPRPAIRPMPNLPFPLSYAQRSIFMLEQISSAPGLFNMAINVHLDRALPVPLVRDAIEALADRHTSLRTRFRVRNGRPEQVIDPQVTIPFEVIDGAGSGVLRLAALPPPPAPSDCPGNPPLRARLFLLDDGSTLVRFDLHHLIADAEAAGILVRDFCAICTTLRRGLPAPFPALTADIADLVAHEAELVKDGAWSADEAFWLHELAGSPVATALPVDFDPPLGGATGRAASLRHRLPAFVRKGLLERAAAHRTTEYAELLACYAILHHRLSGEEEFVVGMPTSVRPGSPFEGVVGCFINVLPLRVAIEEAIDDTIGKVSARIVAALEHRGYPMGLLLERRDCARVGGTRPLFRTVFQLIELPAPLAIDGNPCSLVTPIVDSVCKADLIWTVRDEADGALTVELCYDTSLYAVETAERMLAQFGALARGLAQGAAGSIYGLALDASWQPIARAG